MIIEIQNYRIETNEQSGFNLIENRTVEHKDNTKSIRVVTHAYSISLELAIKKIIHLNLHYNPNIVSLKQFIVNYRNERKKVGKMLEIEKVKNNC